MNFKKRGVPLITYGFKIALEAPRESILPEIDLIRELCLGDLESLRSDVDVLVTRFTRKVNKGQREEIPIETLGVNHVSETRN